MVDKTNLLLVAIDSLRADHMSCYGYPRLTTPHMDDMASKGVLFENAFSPYIPTTPGYTTMLTGMDVMTHQMVSLSPKGPIDPSIKLLPEILRRKGYKSACIGFDTPFYRGFDSYETYKSWMSWDDAPGHKAEALNEKAIPALESMADEPFLLFLRHMDPHSPYLPPPPFDAMFYDKDPCDPSVKTMKPIFAFKPFAEFFKSWMPPGITDADWVDAHYDSSLAYMDACIKRLFTKLEELDLLDSTLVVITSDHGETLTDHGIYYDHHGLYECTIHVPLIYHLPGVMPENKRIGGFVLQQDLAPTVLEIMGYARTASRLGMDGRSVIPMVEGERGANYSEFYISECTWMRKRGWRTPQYKLIQALEPDFHGMPPVELYDLVEDPLENHNVADDRPEIVRSLKTRMRNWTKKRLSETGRPDPILGYRIGVDRTIGSVSRAKDLQAADADEKK
jgi:arylsulfatase A-like enzyme